MKRKTARPPRRSSATFDLATLNPPQLEAVLHDDGPLLILAGAGSGKTRVIIYRIARLIRDGVAPASILGVTFTNKAAREMRERLTALVGPRSGEVLLSTFHSLGLRILREEQAAAGLRPGFTIYDTSDQLSLVRELMRQVRVADRRLDPWRVLELLLAAKRERRSEIPLERHDDYTLAAYELYPRYLAQMRAFNAIDFDDLILRAEEVLDQPAVRRRWQQRFTYLLVDEYQDTSPDQLHLLQQLAGERQNVCVVGDDDQSIYAWRGASADNILSFADQFGGAREIVLDQNYRSTDHILAAANAVISHNRVRKAKRLWTAGGAGDPVEVHACSDGDDEVTLVVDTIRELLAGGASADEIAVLYRTNAQSRAFEEGLALERIPFRVVGGQAFFERKEVRDAVAYLAVAHNPFDEVALRRIINTPPRGIGPAAIERLVEHGERSGKRLWGALTHAGEVEGLPPAAVTGARALCAVLQPAARRLKAARPGELAPLARQLFEEVGLRAAVLASDDAPTIAERRLENLEEVVRSLVAFERQTNATRGLLAEYLRAAALTQESEKEEEPRPQVTLMTLHSAKGLEFAYVFLVGLEEEFLPHKKTMEEGGDLAEERRLCYVGMTRARRRLWLTWARRRARHGGRVERAASRFLAELPDGDGVRRRNRDATEPDAESQKLANDFFAKMKERLGIEGAGEA